jgi:uncharacterized protein DUF4846
MRRVIGISFVLLFTIAFCCDSRTSIHPKIPGRISSDYRTIGDIPLPAGFVRMAVLNGSFAEWLRRVKLKNDSRVYLYNGRLKENQLAQFAVLDIAMSKGDLQQCADAIMRLRAEYFFSRHEIDSIHFKTTDGTQLSFANWLNGERYIPHGNCLIASQTTPSRKGKRVQIEQFLEITFAYCGTLSLQKETRAVKLDDLKIGDVFVKGGSPGHAMLVVDAAIDQSGQKIFMLAQSYMPAQDVHIVKNPLNQKLSPWFMLGSCSKIVTPEWIFDRNQLRRW